MRRQKKMISHVAATSKTRLRVRVKKTRMKRTNLRVATGMTRRRGRMMKSTVVLRN